MRTAFLLAAGLLVSILSPTRERLYTSHYENVLGTSLELKIGATSPEAAEKAETAVLHEIARQAKILSTWDSGSEVSRWARTSGKPVRLSPELLEVLSLFDVWRERTGGALDASAEAVTRLWKSAEKQGRLPSKEELAAAAAAVRQTHWRLDPIHGTATHLSDAALALNSFTKSYIAGHAADLALAVGGVSSVVVNIGGDLVVRGAITEPVDIADPKSDAEGSAPIAQLLVHDRTVATSGNYRRGVEIGGRRFSHIVDPRTGMPPEEIISSTVVARSPSDAGALATAFSVLTPAESQRLAARVPGAEFLLVKNDGTRVASPGWSRLAGVAMQAAQAKPAAAAEPGMWDPSFELTVNIELGALGFYGRRPYVAIWIEDQSKYPVRTIALWYNKDRFLPELRAWYRADGRRYDKENTDITPSISSATRESGKHAIKWDGKDNRGKYVKAGKYTVLIEANAEHGNYEITRTEMDFSGVPKKIVLEGDTEVANASLDYHKIGAR